MMQPSLFQSIHNVTEKYKVSILQLIHQQFLNQIEAQKQLHNQCNDLNSTNSMDDNRENQLAQIQSLETALTDQIKQLCDAMNIEQRLLCQKSYESFQNAQPKHMFVISRTHNSSQTETTATTPAAAESKSLTPKSNGFKSGIDLLLQAAESLEQDDDTNENEDTIKDSESSFDMADEMETDDDAFADDMGNMPKFEFNNE
eukprot:287416_1